MEGSNGQNGYAREALSREEVFTLIDTQAREILGVSGQEALDMLDRGELGDSIFASHLRMLRFLAGDQEGVRA